LKLVSNFTDLMGTAKGMVIKLTGENTGRDFIKKIKPFGAAMFLITFIIVTIFLFTAGRNPIPGYESPQNAQYYMQSDKTIEELKSELEKNVFPNIRGIVSCETDGAKLVVEIEEKSYAVTRSAILHYFDESLFVFVSV